MSEIAILVTTAAIVASGDLDGKAVYAQVPDTNPMYPKMLEAYKAGDKHEVLRLADLTTRVNEFSDGHFEVIDNVVYITDCDEPAPRVLSSKIVEFAKQDLPVTPLVNFWKNLCKNPSFSSREQLFGFLEANHVPLTEDGCFIAYKGVKRGDDGNLWDTHSGTFRNNVGDVCTMDRSKVDDDPNRTCSSGLHVAAHEYAENWGGVLVHCKVNPADVVSVPVDYNQQKMRTCRYEVVAISEDREEMSDRLYDDGTEDDAEVEDYTPDAQDDERLRYVKPRKDGSVEIPQAFIDMIPDVPVIVKSYYADEMVTVTTDQYGTRFPRPGFRVSRSALQEAGIDGAGEYAVEINEDSQVCITITPA